MRAVAETLVGRPRKYKDEKTITVSTRVPTSVKAHLEASGMTASSCAYDVLLFEKDLADGLAECMTELRMWAVQNQGADYSESKAETIARLVKIALQHERKKR